MCFAPSFVSLFSSLSLSLSLSRARARFSSSNARGRSRSLGSFSLYLTSLLPFPSCSHLFPSVPSSSFFPRSAATLQPSAHVSIHSRGHASPHVRPQLQLPSNVLSRPSGPLPLSSPPLIQRFPANRPRFPLSNHPPVIPSFVRVFLFFFFYRPLARNLNLYRGTRKFSEGQRISFRRCMVSARGGTWCESIVLFRNAIKISLVISTCARKSTKRSNDFYVGGWGMIVIN